MSRYGNPELRHVTGCHRSFLFRAGATVAAALVAFAGATPGAVACLYEDPSSASFQQSVLNLSYPKALYVRGAVIQARQDGILPPQPRVPITKDLFGLGYRKAAAMLHRFGEELPPQPNDDAFAFTLVLIEPMLWTRFSQTDGHFTTSVHIDGPQAGDIIVITAETVLQQIVNDRMSPESAEELGLIRLYGDASKFDKLREILADRQSFEFTPLGRHGMWLETKPHRTVHSKLGRPATSHIVVCVQINLGHKKLLPVG